MSPSPIVTRFAPSPTGRLHLGHAYSALLSHDAGDRFVLRIEDLDVGRSRPEFVAGIFEDLRWLGLDWDGEVLFQAEREAAYAGALGRLHDLGLLYVCTCTRAQIAASAPQGDHEAVYAGTCRGPGRAPDAAVPHCWRLDMAKAAAFAGPLEWINDRGVRIAADPQRQGDVVIARKDAAASYHLAVTVDDAHQGVTHVVRGRDLLDATHIHRLLQALLGLPTPIYRHHPLVLGGDGERLAKRRNSTTIATLRAAGFDPATLIEEMRAARFPVGFILDAS